jgi:hypothetical protein
MPARVVRELTPEEAERLRASAALYVDCAEVFRTSRKGA